MMNVVLKMSLTSPPLASRVVWENEASERQRRRRPETTVADSIAATITKVSFQPTRPKLFLHKDGEKKVLCGG